MADIISLGIDTGGTYTDAVLFSDTRGVIAKAKALTTRHDLAVIAAALTVPRVSNASVEDLGARAEMHAYGGAQP